MKIHLAWIRVTAVAAIAAGVGVQQAAAQYAPFRPAPPQPAAPQQAPAPAPVAPYGAYRPQPAYPQTAYQQPTYPQTAYQQPAVQQPVYPRYQAPVTPVAPYQAPANTYRPAVAYPQTAMAQYPAPYGGTPYVAQQQPTEVMPAPQQSPASAANSVEAMPSGAMPADPAASAASGYPAAGCNCGAGGYSAGSYYGAGGAGCTNGYPDVSGYMGDCGNDNIWFGGVYFLYMDRDEPSNQQLTVEVPTGTPYPYYPPKSSTIISTVDADYDFRPGVEVRFGSTFTVGASHGACNSCNSCGSGYGYTGCGCNSCSCKPPTMYAWEFAWWGIENDANQTVYVQDLTLGRMHGMKSFAGLEYDRDGAGGAYTWAPVNDYYAYDMPINAPPAAPYTVSVAQRVWTDFKAQNLELNLIRFPMMCDEGCGGCNSGCGCGGDSCGCNSGCNSGCGCEDDSWSSNFSMYGSCGVRYFRIDDDFSYDTEFATYNGATYDHSYDGFSGMPDLNELCYDINIENNLIGPQFGWTSNCCVGCRWNFFCNTTFGVFDNHITQYQRVWGSGDVQFANSGETMTVRSSKDDIAFLGELRIGGSYDFTCHWRGVLAYRAVGLSGIATSVGQIPDNFSDRADVAQINSDNSMVIHGVQTGVECRY